MLNPQPRGREPANSCRTPRPPPHTAQPARTELTAPGAALLRGGAGRGGLARCRSWEAAGSARRGTAGAVGALRVVFAAPWRPGETAAQGGGIGGRGVRVPLERARCSAAAAPIALL